MPGALSGFFVTGLEKRVHDLKALLAIFFILLLEKDLWPFPASHYKKSVSKSLFISRTLFSAPVTGGSAYLIRLLKKHRNCTLLPNKD